MEDNLKPILGITMGDASGAGPEIIVKALSLKEIYDLCRPLVIGDAAAMEEAAHIVGWSGEIRALDRVEEARFEHGCLDVLDLKNLDLTALVRGRVNPMAGKAAYEYIERATRLALDGATAAIVTGPIHKEAMNAAGYHYAGHTEILADLCGVEDVTMMLVAGNLRVSHVSTHCSLREACERVTTERILTVLKLTEGGVRQMGIAEPRLAVAGLNPHVGEGGLFGREDIEQIAPAVERAKSLGMNVMGPLPPDSVFFRALKGQFDAVVAMYHDQGHIAIKVLGFDEGVNVTLGLPIIRTSVDHGTVFGKAGKGTARPTSMIEAIKLAAKMCTTRDM